MVYDKKGYVTSSGNQEVLQGFECYKGLLIV
jgi:hypothetical protein